MYTCRSVHTGPAATSRPPSAEYARRPGSHRVGVAPQRLGETRHRPRSHNDRSSSSRSHRTDHSSSNRPNSTIVKHPKTTIRFPSVCSEHHSSSRSDPPVQSERGFWCRETDAPFDIYDGMQSIAIAVSWRQNAEDMPLPTTNYSITSQGSVPRFRGARCVSDAQDLSPLCSCTPLNILVTSVFQCQCDHAVPVAAILFGLCGHSA